MKNADMPASPSVIEHVEFDLCCEVDETGLGAIKRDGERRFEVQYHGLTKREHFAATMNHDPKNFNFPDIDAVARFIGREIDAEDYEDLVSAALQSEAKIRVMRADALLAELERTNDN